MNAILIDAENKAVRFVEVDKDDFLNSCYRHIGCSLIQIATSIGKNTVYVDEEGLCKEVKSAFHVRGWPQSFVGNGLVIGYDPRKDKHKDTDLTVPQVHDMITFLNDEQLNKLIGSM